MRQMPWRREWIGLLMGQTAERLASEFHITRREQDEFALRSHQRAELAATTVFKDEICPVFVPPNYHGVAVADNGIRRGQSLDALGKLKPYFEKPEGTVTVGNSSQVTDGACALLVMTPERYLFTIVQQKTMMMSLQVVPSLARRIPRNCHRW